MIKYHSSANNRFIGEILPDSEIISSAQEMLDLMAEAGYMNCFAMIIHSRTLHRDFFDLKTGLAGELLQKFSNYRMKLAIAGDFSGTGSKSLDDFIRESNRTGIIFFVSSVDEALTRLNDRDRKE